MPRLRPREDADCATIAAWIGDAAALRLFTGTRLSWPLDAEQLARMTRVEGFSAWVLVDDVDGAVAGHADLAVQKEDAHVGRVIIDPRRRGEGLSLVLMGLLVEQARRLGATRLSLNVAEGNEPAIRAYERAGFRTARGDGRPGIRAMTRAL